MQRQYKYIIGCFRTFFLRFCLKVTATEVMSMFTSRGLAVYADFFLAEVVKNSVDIGEFGDSLQLIRPGSFQFNRHI